MDDLVHGEPAHLEMQAGQRQLVAAQLAQQVEAAAAQLTELVKQLGWGTLAVGAAAGDLSLVPGLELGLGTGQQQAYAAGEAALLSLDDVADALVGAPLPRRRMPRGDRDRQRVELGSEGSPGRVEGAAIWPGLTAPSASCPPGATRPDEGDARVPARQRVRVSEPTVDPGES